MYRSALSLYAADGLRELREVHGVSPTDAEIVRLNELGWNVDDDARSLPGPKEAGGAILHPATAMALSWFYDHACAFGDSRRMRMFAYAFALAHGRGLALPPRVLTWQERVVRRLLGIGYSVTLDQVQGGMAARRAVRAWMLTCDATLEEIEQAITALEHDTSAPAEERARSAIGELFAWFGDDSKALKAVGTLADAMPKRGTSGVSLDDMCSEMAATTGTDQSMWRRIPCAAAARVWQASMRIRTGAVAGDSGEAEAVKQFRAAMVEIIAAHNQPKPEASKNV